MSVGARVTIETPGHAIPCEVVGFSGGNALLMPFAPLEGVRRGCRAVVSAVRAAVRPSDGWLGRVVNAHGEPLGGKGPLPAVRRRSRSATLRLRTRASASADRSTSGSGPSTPS
jgi:flagellum-specific ATP synthase